MMPSLSQTLRETNQRLRFLLDIMAPRLSQPALPTPEQMASLLSELSGAGSSLREHPISETGQYPELDVELDHYRRNVERLRDTMPAIHGQLLAERARLESQRSQVQSAADWARASRQTL